MWYHCYSCLTVQDAEVPLTITWYAVESSSLAVWPWRLFRSMYHVAERKAGSMNGGSQPRAASQDVNTDPSGGSPTLLTATCRPLAADGCLSFLLLSNFHMCPGDISLSLCFPALIRAF